MSLTSPNFDVKSIIFPNFGQGPFPKIAEKALALMSGLSHVQTHEPYNTFLLLQNTFASVHLN